MYDYSNTHQLSKISLLTHTRAQCSWLQQFSSVAVTCIMSAVSRESDVWKYFDKKDDNNVQICPVKAANHRNTSVIFKHIHFSTRKNQQRQTAGSPTSHHLLKVSPVGTGRCDYARVEDVSLLISTMATGDTLSYVLRRQKAADGMMVAAVTIKPPSWQNKSYRSGKDV